MHVRTRLAVCPLEERWVPAGTPTGTTGGTTPAATTAAATTTAATTTTPTGPTFLADRGVKPVVTLVTATGTAGSSVSVYDTTYTGGVWVARADVTGDGTTDAIVAPGAGTTPTVKVVSGSDGTTARTFDAYESTYTGGVVVAAVDLNGDGRADLITGTDQGGGPRVRVFDGLSNAVLADFFAIDDPNFRGGVRVAAGDVNGDGVPDLIAAAGYGGGPRVAIWDGKALLRGVQQRVCGDFFAFEPTLRNGVYPAVGAYNADKFADVLLGAGPGGGPRVKAVSGQLLTSTASQAAADKPLFDFFAGLADDRGGVRVGAVPGAGTGTAVLNDVLTVGGSGGIGTLYNGTTRKGTQSVDRELILAGGLLADTSGQKLFGNATTTGTGGTTGGTTTGSATTVSVGTSLQTLLNSLGG